ncbi:MAG: amidohydrolase family protein [Actinobacteria bacterium]|nr:amidohydrolase family protein [Actinomycetota bacterium]
MPLDKVLLDGVLADGRVVDVQVADGMISAIVGAGSAGPAGGDRFALGGRLLLPALAEPHAHLDKALVAATINNETGDLYGAMDAMDRALKGWQFTHDGIVDRASRAVEMLIGHGVTLVRTHVNVGEAFGAAHIHAIVQVRRAYEHLIDIEIVALTQPSLTGSAGRGNRAALAAALAAGADLVGACPHLDDDPVGCVGVVFDAATDAGVGLDLHTDETLDAGMLTLRDVARAVQQRGFPHLVAASHCVSLSMLPIADQRVVAAEVAAAGIAVIPQPQTNLYLQGRGLASAMPRGLAPIDVLREAGVLVAAGGDNVQDPFNPLGRCDPLETAALLVMAGHQLPDVAYAMVSNDARQVMGRQRIEMTVGDPADFVALPVASAREAIATAVPDRLVFRAGQLVASTTWQTTLHR